MDTYISAMRRKTLTVLGTAISTLSSVGLSTDSAAANTSLTIEQEMGNGLLRGNSKRCALSGNVLEETELELGEQLRVRCSDANYESCLYTVVDNYRQKNIVGMSKDGLNRIGVETGSSGTIRAYAPHPEYSTRMEADEHDEYAEILRDDGEQSTLVACAPHGGWIEYLSDKQAARVADSLDVTEWSCAGYNSGGGAFDRWQISSTAIDERSFSKLGSIADRGFDHAVSFHGFSQDGIVVGGRAPESLKKEMCDAIDTATDGVYDVSVADEDEPYAGVSTENFVNWLSTDGNGVQIEQSWTARVDDWEPIADAVADVYADVL